MSKPNLASYSEEDEKRMNIIGQNGNNGDHYEALKSVDVHEIKTH